MADDRNEAREFELPPQEPPKESEPVQKVTDLPHGAKRDGYFKRRDYDE